MKPSNQTRESLEIKLSEIAKRNEVRAKEAREKLGEKWVLHISNAPKKKTLNK